MHVVRFPLLTLVVPMGTTASIECSLLLALCERNFRVRAVWYENPNKNGTRCRLQGEEIIHYSYVFYI